VTLRLRLLAALVGVLAVSVAVALLIADATLGQELIVFGVAVLLGIGIGLVVVTPLARSLQGAPAVEEPLPGEGGGEMRDSVRRLGEALRSTHDLVKLLSVVLESALAAVDGKAGAVYLMSARHGELLMKVGRHVDPAVAQRRIPVGHGLAGWVAQARTAVLLPSTPEVSPADPEPSEATAMAVPLESQNHLLGVLAIYGRKRPGSFREDDLGTIEFLARQAGVGIDNIILHEEAERHAITDGLTSVWNRRYFQMRLPEYFARAQRHSRPLSILMIDIDDFKLMNDRYGHQRGDATLIELASRVTSQVRGKLDMFARYGGEEFVLILDEIDAEGARVAAERIRKEVTAHPFGTEEETPVDVSVSVGFATYPHDGTTEESLVAAADRALYAAKARGKDRIVGAAELSDEPSLARKPRRP